MSSAKRAIPFVILAGVAAMVGGGIYLYKRTDGNQRIAREQAFADLSQCLLGEVIASGDDTINSINTIQNRVAHRPDESRGAEDGKPWPQRCGSHARTMMDKVRESSFMDEAPKRDLLKELDLLAKDLESPGATETYLAHSVLGVWRTAEKSGLAMAAGSKVSGPPKPAVMAGGAQGAADLPFSSILPVRNGNAWHFLADRKDKPGVLASCAATKEGLDCADFTVEGSVNPIGTWSGARAIPLWDGKQLLLLSEGKLDAFPAKFAGEPRVHVDEAGVVFALGTSFVDDEVKLQLSVLAPGKKAKSVLVEKALEKASEGAGVDAVTATLAGPNVVIRRTLGDAGQAELQMFAIDADGKLSPPTKIPTAGKPDRMPAVCRVGASFALNVGSRSSSLVFYDAGKWSGPVQHDGRNFDCSPSGGIWVTASDYCRASGCIEAFAKADKDAFTTALGGLPKADVMGDRIVSAWGAKDGNGVLVRIAKIGSGSSGVSEVLISERSDPKAWNLAGVFADKLGAIVLAEIEQRVVGAHVSLDGTVGPLKVTSK